MLRQLSTEVLIIGGGPAGMTSAIYLDILGISSIVLERRTTISSHPKAHELSARSIEILGQLGIGLEELKAEASPYSDASKIVFGHTINEVFGEIDLSHGGNDEKYQTHLSSAEPYLNLSQTELERVLRKRLQSCQFATFLVGVQWDRFDQSIEGVTSWTHDRSSDQNYSIQSQYVICADGASSRSREALGIRMIGQEKLNDFVSVYFEKNLRKYVNHNAKLYWIFHPEAPGTFIAHHIEKRWVYHFPIFTPHESMESYTKELLQKRIQIALGNQDIPIDIKSISLWRMTCQIADRFQNGRVFLVGDAAHRFPPTGGLGMNTGIGDVQNLCWKLALVIKGHAADSLLPSYEEERRPVIETNSTESLRNYYKIWDVPRSMGLQPQALKWQAILFNHPLVKLFPQSVINGLLRKMQTALSKRILKLLSQPPKLRRVQGAISDQVEHFDRIGLDLGYTYSSGALVGTDQPPPISAVSSYRPSVQPGARFPHFWIQLDGQRVSSHEWLDSTRFILLCNDLGMSWWTKHQTRLDPAIRRIMEARSIEQEMRQLIHPEIVRKYYSIEQTPLLLIRPDGLVAWKPSQLDSSIFNQLTLIIPTK